MKIRETLERALSSRKAGAIVTLSATAISAGLMYLATDRDNSTSGESPTPQTISLAIGILCAAQTAQVSEVQIGHSYTFRCTDTDGQRSPVLKEVNTDPTQTRTVQGYNRVVLLNPSWLWNTVEIGGSLYEGVVRVEQSNESVGSSDYGAI